MEYFGSPNCSKMNKIFSFPAHVVNCYYSSTLFISSPYPIISSPYSIISSSYHFISLSVSVIPPIWSPARPSISLPPSTFIFIFSLFQSWSLCNGNVYDVLRSPDSAIRMRSGYQIRLFWIMQWRHHLSRCVCWNTILTLYWALNK